MSVAIPVSVSLFSILITILVFTLYYSHQVMTDLRVVLEANRNKRDKVILSLHTEAKKKLDHVAEKIREEVIESPTKAAETKSEDIAYYRDKLVEAYYLLDDAKDIRDSLRVSLKAFSRIRLNAVFLLLIIILAALTISLSTGLVLEELTGFWAIIFFGALPVSGVKIFKSYKTYKTVGGLLSAKGVGIHDESR